MKYEVISYTPERTSRIYDGSDMSLAMAVATETHATNAAAAQQRGRPRVNPIIAIYQDGQRALTYAARPTETEQKGWTLECTPHWPLY